MNNITHTEIPQPVWNSMIIGTCHNCEISKGRICFTTGKLLLKPQSRERLTRILFKPHNWKHKQWLDESLPEASIKRASDQHPPEASKLGSTNRATSRTYNDLTSLFLKQLNQVSVWRASLLRKFPSSGERTVEQRVGVCNKKGRLLWETEYDGEHKCGGQSRAVYKCPIQKITSINVEVNQKRFALRFRKPKTWRVSSVWSFKCPQGVRICALFHETGNSLFLPFFWK